MFRRRLRISRHGLELGLRTTANARRSLHCVPYLPHDYTKGGVPNLMSPNGFALAWTEHMAFLVERMNALTSGTELEDLHPRSLVILSARDPSKAPLFNYASMAFNNHFFFRGISPTGSGMCGPLRKELEASFSSIETLRREFVLTAAAMFGPGFVWLVKAGSADYRVLPTYLAGSPYPGAHWRAQPTDMNTVGNDGTAKSYFKNQAAGARNRDSDLPPGGIDLKPLLCLNTWENAWLFDWGFGAGGRGGKVAYAESWWELIDWARVADLAGVLRPQFKSGADG